MSAPDTRTADIDRWRARYLAAQLVGRRRDALQVLDDALADGCSVIDLQLRVVQQAQREIGALWEQNRISIAQELMATAISQMALAQLYTRAQIPAPLRKKVVFSCVEGELHDLPARLAADVLELAGFDVIFLGANVPTDHLITMLDVEQPDLLCLSVTMLHNVGALRSAVAAVRARPVAPDRPRLPILVGGNACKWSPGIVADIGADGSADDAVGLVRCAKELVGAAP